MEPNFIISAGTYDVWKFPSGEVQVSISHPSAILQTITGSIVSSDHIMELLQLVEAIHYHSPNCEIDLVMPYCFYSRQDRRCNSGEAFSLKVFANLINSCNFIRVTTYDNHSDVSTALINNCYNNNIHDVLERTLGYNNPFGIEAYKYFISPDAGANKKVQECSKHFNIPMIRADKIRDTATGVILETQVFATPEQLKGKTVLIIDDICQGGRTFEELAKAIKAIEPTCTIHLYVTHGFFSHQFGIQYMQSAGISEFITTDSVYAPKGDIQQQFVTVIPLQGS